MRLYIVCHVVVIMGIVLKSMQTILIKTLDMTFQEHGNKREDCEKSNIKYEDKVNYNYKIVCTRCGQVIWRQRYNKQFTLKYRCGKCGGKFIAYKVIKTKAN